VTSNHNTVVSHASKFQNLGGKKVTLSPVCVTKLPFKASEEKLVGD